MDLLNAEALSAVWLGILASLSPCGLATNIAAVGFIGKRIGSINSVILTGFLYTFGRMFAYFAIASVVIAGILSIPDLSNFLQKYMNIIVGPVLFLIGLVLFELIKFNFSSGWLAGKIIRKHSEKKGLFGACILGFVFALNFCPISAGLFFGSLIPLSVSKGSIFLFPALFGIGTGLPVLFFAFILAFGTNSAGRIFKRLVSFELWARKVTGVIFLFTGVWFIFRYIFNV